MMVCVLVRGFVGLVVVLLVSGTALGVPFNNWEIPT
jgi:hypothetical protein